MSETNSIRFRCPNIRRRGCKQWSSELVQRLFNTRRSLWRREMFAFSNIYMVRRRGSSRIRTPRLEHARVWRTSLDAARLSDCLNPSLVTVITLQLNETRLTRVCLCGKFFKSYYTRENDVTVSHGVRPSGF